MLHCKPLRRRASLLLKLAEGHIWIRPNFVAITLPTLARGVYGRLSKR